MTDDERIPDEFEVTARKWAAQEKILENCAKLVEDNDLDPALLKDLREAYNAQDEDEFLEALAVLWERSAIAQGDL